MKKGWMVFGIIFLLIIIPFVSAGFFGNIWGKITGKVTAGFCSGEIDESSAESYCEALSIYQCETIGNPCYVENDRCVFGLDLAFCGDVSDSVTCQSLGCVWHIPSPSFECFDSDGSLGDAIIQATVKGKATDDGGLTYTFDSCSTNKKVEEVICDPSGIIQPRFIDCSRYVGADYVCKEFPDGAACVIGTTSATCVDGIQNQGESGIDCGGPCAACSESQESELPTTCGECVSANSNYYWCGQTSSCNVLSGTPNCDLNTYVSSTYGSCPQICEDSDGGKSYTVKGNTSKGTGSATDVCVSDTKLYEYYCNSEGNIASKAYTCPGGCLDGECQPYCGDGICSDGETSSSCSIDCGPAYLQYATCQICTSNGFTWCTGGEETSCVSDATGCPTKINDVNKCSVPAECSSCVNSGGIWCENPKKASSSFCDVNPEGGVSYACGYAQGTQKTTCSTSTTSQPSSSLCNYGLKSLSGVDSSVKKFINSINGTKCGLTFGFNKLDSLPGSIKFLENMNIIAIFDITSNEATGADVSFVLNDTVVDYPSEIGFYTWSGTTWEKLSRGEANHDEQKKQYSYNVRADHFSLFVIAEPLYCGNDVFDKSYEECDGSDNCTSSCLCESGFVADGAGNCVEDLSGLECSNEGDEDCVGSVLYECDSSLEWDKQGIVANKCEVECLNGNVSCQGEYPLTCGSDYQWIVGQRIVGKCGYAGTTNTGGEILDRCGNGYCNYDEDEFNCPEDCSEKGVGTPDRKTFLTILIIVLSVLILVVLFILIKVFNKERRRGINSDPNRNIPPEHRPGPKRGVGRPPVIQHGQIGRPPERRVSPGGYAVRKYPVRRYPPR